MVISCWGALVRKLLMMKPRVVFVLGGPGAGKGTQCIKIVEKYGYTHLSAGDLLRAERSKEATQYGELIDSYIKEGKIVPVEITINLIKRNKKEAHSLNGKRLRSSEMQRDLGVLVHELQKAMDETMAEDATKNKFLIDGFPRNTDNLDGWNRKMDNNADVKFVLFFDCSNDICIERCLERGKGSGRTDDNIMSLEKRIQTYMQSTKPIIELYEKEGKVRRVDGAKSVDEVFVEVQKIFDAEN
ncbi:UMP-CMP kinase isoform X1 [Heterodontus francisci]|uniref:UMP-CMP kinase isoform X1 n=1 Tax=Heterodontus francisci TaxID=7792 RepID=UPI00355B8D58